MHAPDRWVLSRWLFNALGYLLIFGDHFVVRHLLGFHVHGTLSPDQLVALFGLYTIPTGVLCWITASGLKRHRWWRFAAGIPACLLLLAGFPWLSIAGCLGFYALFTAPAKPAPAAAALAAAARTTDYWQSKRRSKLQPVIFCLLWFVAFFAEALFALHAHRAGMPEWRPGVTWWLWLFAFLLVNTALHESGHTIFAWALGYRVRVLSIGPFTYWKGRSGSRFTIQWERLFSGGGYMGAVPLTDRNLRWNHIVVIAAGPAANFLLCLISLDIFLALRGTPWQAWWGPAAVSAIAAGVLTVGNLIPVGYCDGTMLLHLVFNTLRGKQLLQNLRIHQLDEDADDCHDRADFQKEIELKEEMLRRALVFGRANALMIAACHQDLGSSYRAIDEWALAEFHYRQSLEFESEVAAVPALAANLWSGIELTATRRHDAAEARRAYVAVLPILDSQKRIGEGINGPGMTFLMLAQAHQWAGAFDQGMAAADRGLALVPGRAESLLLRALLLRSRAVCCAGANDMAAALADAGAAAEILRSTAVPEGKRNLAFEHLADLGAELSRAELAAAGIDFLGEGIQQLKAGGADFAATRFQIRLASVLRQQERLQEALSMLPSEETVAPELRRAFLEERIELDLADGHPELAASRARELVELWKALPAPAAPEIASAQALLARALTSVGDADAVALTAETATGCGPTQPRP